MYKRVCVCLSCGTLLVYSAKEYDYALPPGVHGWRLEQGCIACPNLSTARLTPGGWSHTMQAWTQWKVVEQGEGGR